MPDGDAIHRAAAALRTALCDKKMVRFDAPKLIGVVPRAGRTIERIDCHGRHLEMQWDDGIILHTNLRLQGSWHLHRRGAPWKLAHDQVRVLVEVPGWVAVCFNAPLVETYRVPDARRHPGLGGLGPDLCRADADLRRCVELLLAYPVPTTPLHEVLLDQRVLCGVGNVYRSEVLWACELSPFAPIGDVGELGAIRLVNVAARLLRANLQHADRIPMPGVAGGLAVYGRRGQRCQRCGDSIRERVTGRQARSLYWCAGCQVRLDPRQPVAADAVRSMDPHPAATLYLSHLPWRRTG